jgi:putative tricarboxylic transport membrane protein
MRTAGVSKELIGRLAFIVLGLYGFILSWRLPFGSLDRPGPAVFPFLLSLVLTLIGILLLFERETNPDSRPSADTSHGKPWEIVALTALFILLFERIGYLEASYLYLVFLLFRVCRFRWWVASGAAAAIALTSWFVFAKLLGLQLPVGFLKL